MKLKLIRKADIIIIVSLLIICSVLLIPRFFSKKKLTATVYQNGKAIEQIDLSQVEKEYELNVDGAVIFVEKNAISFLSADCPDKLCVKCGRLTHSGDTAVCVPTGTVITVSGNSEKQVDAVSY